MTDSTKEESDAAIAPGAVRSVIYYQNASGEPARKSVATRAEIHEIDLDGRVVFRTFADLDSEE